MSKDSSYSVLLPPEPQEGGLSIVKSGIRRNPDTDTGQPFEFKVPLPPDQSRPRCSLLGLDRLAAAKRREKQLQQEQEPTSKRSKVYSYKDGEDEAEDTSSSSRTREERERHYRSRDEALKASSTLATPTPHHRLYHQDFKDSRSLSSSKSKGIFATSNKHGKLVFNFQYFSLFPN